jgi:CHASE3 domain sensor protein
VLLLGICFAAIRQTKQWEENAQALARSNQVIERLEDLSLQSTDAEAAARRFIITPGVLDLARCRRSLSQVLAREKELEALVADSESQRRNVQAVRRLIDQQAETMLRSLPPPTATGAAGAGNPADIRRALAALDSAGLSANLRSVILGMEAEENRVLGESTVRHQRTLVVIRVLFLVASTISLILIVVAGWRIRSWGKGGQLSAVGRGTSCRQWRSGAERAAQIRTTTMVAAPPPATLTTGPNQAAVQPDSTAPNWFDELMKILLKARTRPRT